MYKVIFYQTARGEELATKFIKSFDHKIQGKIFRWIKRLEEEGSTLPRPYADILRDKIYELRIVYGRLEIRLLYFFHGQWIIITHGFLKKTATVSKIEIEKAIIYRKDFLEKGSV